MIMISDTLIRWHVPALILVYLLLIPYGESNLAIMLVFAILGAYMLLRRRISISHDYKSWIVITLALSTPIAISLFTALRFEKTLITLIAFLLHALAGIYIIDQVRKHERPTTVIFGIAAIVGLWTLSALPNQIRGVETGILQQWVGHITGNYGNFPNMGNVLAHLSPFYFEAIYRLSKRLNGHWPWLLAIPLILSILIAGGRSGWIILILVMTIFTLRLIAINHFSKLALSVALTLALSAVVVSTLMLPQVEKKVIQSLTAIDGSFEALDQAGSERWQIWMGGLELVPERMIAGHGTHATGNLIYERGSTVRKFGYEHLYWLEVLLATGLAGLLLYLAVFSYLVFLIIKRTDWYGFSFSPMLAAICILFPLNVHWEFYGPRAASLMWMLLMLAYTFYLIEHDNAKTTGGRLTSTPTK